MKEQEYLIALNMVQGLGSVKIMNLLEHFVQPGRVFAAAAEELSKVDGISFALSGKIQAIVRSREFSEELRLLQREKIHCITLIDDAYPLWLKQIYDPPAVLYVLGDVCNLDELAIAVIGCRRASFYGIHQAERIAGELAAKGVCVVSGLARGIDTAAHRGALAVGGKTIAVLGSGLCRIYPAQNKDLAKKISRQGAIISEFPLQMPPLKVNFPRRNRIISGLSRAVVVVEAAKRSGSLITADLALEQGREVFAVPGAAGSMNAQGTNKLIKQGAKLIEGAEDILEELNFYKGMPGTAAYEQRQEGKDIQPLKTVNTLTEGAGKLLEILSFEPLHIDLLIEQSKLSPSCVYQYLLELQLKGLIKELEGKMFVRKEG